MTIKFQEMHQDPVNNEFQYNIPSTEFFYNNNEESQYQYKFQRVIKDAVMKVHIKVPFEECAMWDKEIRRVDLKLFTQNYLSFILTLN